MESCEAEFDNKFTKAFGAPSGRAITKISGVLSEPIKEFIAESPFVVMATSDSEGRCDASPKGGKPGFVRVLDDGHLLFPDVAGNKLFQSYQNMDANPHVGLVFFIPGLAEVVRVNGRVSIVTREELDRHKVESSMQNPDGDRGVQQGIVIEVEESYGHCPRALNYSDFWDVERIQERRGGPSRALIPPAPTAPQPAPAAQPGD
jgi:PPOX class probable FMN-dependent enzyme